MSYEEKRNDLIHTIKVIIIICVSIAGIVGGLFVWLAAGKEQRDKYRQKVKVGKDFICRAFSRFASGR